MKEANKIITITIYKDNESKQYHSELSFESVHFDKEEVLDLIKHQFDKFVLNDTDVEELNKLQEITKEVKNEQKA